MAKTNTTNGDVPAEQTDGYWLGFMSGSVALALGLPHLEGGRDILENAMDKYVGSPACPAKSRRELRTMMKGEK